MTNLKELFNHVVDDEQREDALACHHKVVAGRHVADQLHRAEVPWRNDTSSGWELQDKTATQVYAPSTRVRADCCETTGH